MTNPFVLKLSGLAKLTADDIRALDKITTRPRRYVARQDLIREGDEPGPMFVVLEGWVCRYKILPSGARQIMAFLMPAMPATCTSRCWQKWTIASRRSRRQWSPRWRRARWRQ